MPTASGLPFLTGAQGLESGVKMGTSIMDQILQRQKLAQQQRQFDQQQALRQQQEKRLYQQAQHPQAISSIGKVLSDIQAAEARGAPKEEINLLRQYGQRLAEGAPGIQLSVDPATGAVTFASGGRGVQSTTQQLVDGQVISKPTMATMSQQQQQQLSSVAREQALKHIKQPYLGAGASLNMLIDIMQYEMAQDTDKKQALAQKLINSAVSEKIAPEVGALQLLSQGVRPTVHALRAQEHSIRQGWPTFGKRIVDMLPSELQDRVVEEHNKRLKELTDVRQKHFVQGFPYSFAPKPQAEETKDKKDTGIMVYNPKTGRLE